MLTARENFYEAVKGGHPDRFVNQFEALCFQNYPGVFHNPMPRPGQENVVNAWGVTNSYPAGVPGLFPVHTPDKIVIKDIEHWKDYVHAPSLDFPEAEWDMCRAQFDAVDTKKAYKALGYGPGIFEMCHNLGEISNTLMNLMIYPDEMHELIRYLTDYEMRLAELICDKLHPEALLHSDDFGSRTSTFMSPEMFEEFLLEPYQQIYAYYKSHGVELIIHHSDSYAATLVPSMKKMGIDVWQGCMTSNNIPQLVRENAGTLGFMGSFDGADFDLPNWEPEALHEAVYRVLDATDPFGCVPCVAQATPGSVFPGVYQRIADVIDDYNAEKFGHNRVEIAEMRLPLQIIVYGEDQ